MNHLSKLTVLVVVAMAPLAAAQKVVVQQKFPAGHYKMTTKQVQDMKTILNGRPMGNTQTNMTMEMGQEITKANAKGIQSMKITYDKIRQTMTMRGQKTVFDSTDKNTYENGIVAGIKPLVGKSITATIKDHKVTQVKGMDEIWDATAKAMTSAKAMPNSGPRFAKMMKASMGNETMKSIFAMSAEVLPAKPVAVGETWSSKVNIPMPVFGKIKMTFDCKLDKVEDKIAFVSFKGKMDTDTTNAKLPAPGAKIEKLCGDYTGIIRVNTATGLMLGQTTKMDMKMKVSVQQGQRKMNTDIAGDIKQDISVEEVK